jgi:hypothetical protein|tara:strand:+ start:43326 stop:43451 length:126 start_codon:yes stop_codon:yes gene_type:complete
MYASNVLARLERLVRRAVKAYNVNHQKTLFSKLNPTRTALV